jgi:integrase
MPDQHATAPVGGSKTRRCNLAGQHHGAAWAGALELPPITFHVLRHTAATLLLGQGEHPKVVQELLGHAQVSITLDRYSHMTPTLMSGAAATMDQLLGG